MASVAGQLPHGTQITSNRMSPAKESPMGVCERKATGRYSLTMCLEEGEPESLETARSHQINPFTQKLTPLLSVYTAKRFTHMELGQSTRNSYFGNSNCHPHCGRALSEGPGGLHVTGKRNAIIFKISFSIPKESCFIEK